MPKNIIYVACPECKGEFYVTKAFFEQRGAKCHCPFCSFEFTPGCEQGYRDIGSSGMKKNGYVEEFLPKRKIGYLFPLLIVDHVPYEFYRIAPEGIMLLLLPVGLKEFTLKDVERAFAPLEQYVTMLVEQDVNILVQGGVPPALLMGLERHDALLERMRKASGLPATSTVLNVVASAKSLGMRRIVLANKWSPGMNRTLGAFFEREGIEVTGTASRSLDPDEFLKMKGRESLQLAYDLARAALKDHPDADGLYIGGSAWLTFPLILPLEKEFGKPVITNDNATVRDLCRLMDIWRPIAGGGRLLEQM